MEEEVKVKTKLKIVLNELIKNDFRVTDDTIFEKLITHLSKTGIGSQVLDVPCCVKWVHSVILSWQCCKINANVMTFALRLLAIIVENESSFHYIQSPASFSGISGPESPDTNDSSLLLLLQQVCTAASTSNSNFSIKCAMVQFLSSLLKHQSGRKWIMLSGLWREVHTMSLNDSSIYVVRDSRRFLSNLLNEMPASQESELEAVLRYILEPITEVASFGELPSDNSKVLGSLHLASEIIQNVFLTTDTKTLKMHSPVAGLILKPNCTLLPKCLDAIKVCKIIEVEELVSKIAVLMYILTATKDGIARAGLGNKAICILILDVFNDLINKGSVENVLKLCVVCHNHWTYASKIRNYAVENNIDIKLNDGETKVDKRYRFEDQLLCIQLTPLCVGCTIGDSTLESYFQIQWAQRLDFNVMRSMYTLRDFVVKSRHLMDRSALQSVATLCSLIARNVNPEIERERAVLVFQSFIYVLKHFVVCANSETKQGGWGGELRESHYSTLLVAILDGLANLIRSHRITWRESVESFCLLTLAQNLLDNPTFSSKAGLVVQALQLIQLCIENFMPPNLALLTNSLSGTGLEHLGPLIFKRLHDPNWEVRDSSLEVLLTLATISYTKYPLFQELILDSKLCEVVVQLSINDAEVYVCASATKCLTAMVKVDRLWNEELNDKDLVNKMIGILNGESEGVLRREASLLMSQIFKYRKVPLEVLGNMCVTMANVVLSDLHWEVKVNALNFWELIIEHQMNDQGMIDGVFPQVTFSKEHRKIINLTPAAIQERLKKVLAELSRNGCLYVLLQAVCTDEDLEVVKKASQIISSLSVVLEKHGLLDLSNTATLQSQSFEATVLKDLKHETNQFDHIPDTPDSLWSVESNEPSQTGSGTYKPEQCSSLNPSECLNPPGKSILDLDPQMMGFAALTDDDDFHSVPKSDLQEKVIDSILNDRDIHLLAKVYLGTNAEEPGRRGPETKISKPVRPLVILSSGDFLHQLTKLDVDKIVKEKIRWIEDTGDNLETLLDDMLISRNIHTENEEDCNAMDCY